MKSRKENWLKPDGHGPREGDLVRFVPFVVDPVSAMPVTGRLLLDQDTSGGNRRWTIEYSNEVESLLVARCYSNRGALVLLGRSPHHGVHECQQ